MKSVNEEAKGKTMRVTKAHRSGPDLFSVFFKKVERDEKHAENGAEKGKDLDMLIKEGWRSLNERRCKVSIAVGAGSKIPKAVGAGSPDKTCFKNVCHDERC